MRIQHWVVVGLLAVGTQHVSAADRYVRVDGADHGDFSTWATAANSIQLAVDAATNVGDTVWVSNGTYTVTNQINVAGKITVRSVGGHALAIVSADWPAYTNRCFHLSGGAVVDGFTITNGHTYSASGGGAYVTGGATLQNCTLVKNMAVHGGGAYVDNGTLSNCTVSANSVVGPAGDTGNGGGVFLVYGARALDCTITGNTTAAKGLGGGVYVSSASPVNVIAGGLIAGNWGGYGGGGCYLYSAEVKHVVVSNNTNSAYAGGGGVFILGGVIVTNCMIVDNQNLASGGGGVGFGSGVGTVVDCLIARNTSHGGGSGRIGGGGVLVLGGGVVDRCRILANTSKGSGTTKGGGGVMISGLGTVKNSLIAQNTNLVTTGYGGGVLLNTTSAETPTLLNCTVVDNYSVNEGGGLAALASPVFVANSIVSGNRAKNGSPELYTAGDSAGGFWHCCIPVALPADQDNITDMPVFNDPAAGDYGLRRRSPGINVGMNGVWTTGVDLIGQPRISPKYNGTVDMGAYEYAFPAGSTFFMVR